MAHWLFANDFPHIILIIESCLCLSESSVRLSKHDCKMLMQYLLKMQLGVVGFPSHTIYIYIHMQVVANQLYFSFISKVLMLNHHIKRV